MRKIFIFLTIAALMIGFRSMSFSAEQWPTKHITCIVPYRAGGSADRLARGIAPFLEKTLGVPFIIENRSGAAGQIGTTIFLDRSVDGYTILLHAQPYLSSSIVIQGAKYSIDDLDIINAENFGAISVSVHDDSPYGTFDELIKGIKDNPDKLKVGVVQGGSPHLLMLLLIDELGLKVRVVPYSSGAPIRTALLGKHIDFSTNGAVTDATMKPRARSLALSTKTKLDVWPNSPYINDVLKKYGVTMPEIGDVRFFSFKKPFREKYPDRWSKFLGAYKSALQSHGYKEYTTKIGTAAETQFRGPERSCQIVNDMHNLLVKYKDKFKK